ncbi:hypothetical protein [Yokenella regensburgei]|uniref:hypothetical protein n=1 Tax=Yokenella regensburgei TaxID=158877 RepID=UPI001432D106|nr:hypothetical protein [Yokenella regensburgei]QIU92552.1 hypothetical protein HEC60_24790 [Yokenella regensburgei]
MTEFSATANDNFSKNCSTSKVGIDNYGTVCDYPNLLVWVDATQYYTVITAEKSLTFTVPQVVAKQYASPTEIIIGLPEIPVTDSVRHFYSIGRAADTSQVTYSCKADDKIEVSVDNGSIDFGAIQTGMKKSAQIRWTAMTTNNSSYNIAITAAENKDGVPTVGGRLVEMSDGTGKPLLLNTPYHQSNGQGVINLSLNDRGGILGPASTALVLTVTLN